MPRGIRKLATKVRQRKRAAMGGAKKAAGYGMKKPTMARAKKAAGYGAKKPTMARKRRATSTARRGGAGSALGRTRRRMKY